jgi:hypothetical protein
VVAFVAVREARSDDPTDVARFDISPIPSQDYGTVTPPDTANAPACTFPADERPSADSPPLPCRHENAEPGAGALPTAAAAERPDVAEATGSYDNPAFRLTFAVPEPWFVNMRLEGGEFYVYDPVALIEQQDSKGLAGGVVLHFSAAGFSPSPDPNFAADVEVRLRTPSAAFGAYAGVIWEEQLGGGAGLDKQVQAAFLRDGILFRVVANFGIGSSDEQLAADTAVVMSIIQSVTPY